MHIGIEGVEEKIGAEAVRDADKLLVEGLATPAFSDAPVWLGSKAADLAMSWRMPSRKMPSSCPVASSTSASPQSTRLSFKFRFNHAPCGLSFSSCAASSGVIQA
jgi:hypothetical protein